VTVVHLEAMDQRDHRAQQEVLEDLDPWVHREVLDCREQQDQLGRTEP